MADKTLDFVLIIGITDYSTFDRSTDQPGGTSDVPGGRNDARAWLRQCLAMGMAAENIRVLSTPVLAAEDMDSEAALLARGVHFAEATHDNMLAGLIWLAESLAGEGARAGLMTFSGHGAGHDESSRALLLCPSDCRASSDGSLEDAVDVMALRRRLGQGEGAREWTMVLDCCSAQAGIGRASAIRARLRARLERLDGPEATGLEQRILSACAWDQTSVSARFGGQVMGAFTWAMLSAMGQWQTTGKHGVLWLEASYGQLWRRARALLSALSFAQTPVLSGPPGVARMPFLCPSEHLGEAGTSFEPNADDQRRQLDAGDSDFRVYTLMLHDTASALYGLLAYVFVSNDAGTVTLADGSTIDLPADIETWYVTPLEQIGKWMAGGMEQLCIVSSPSESYIGARPNILMGSRMVQETAPVEAQFHQVVASAGYPTGGYVFSSSLDQPSIPAAICITPTSDGAALGRVDWYIPQSEYTDTNLFSSTGGDGGSSVYVVSNTQVLDASWYQATSRLTPSNES